MHTDDANRPTFDAARELRLALRQLGEVSRLQASPLARTALVRERALLRYAGQPFAEGRALRALLLETLAQLDGALAAAEGRDGGAGATQLRGVLGALARGESVAAAARSLGLPASSHAVRLLYRAQPLLVRAFLERAGQMAPAQRQAAAAEGPDRAARIRPA